MTELLLLPCRWRGDLNSEGRFPCRSTKILAPRGVTTALCAGCSLRNHEPMVEASLSTPLMSGGPGTELRRLLLELGITTSDGCLCAARATQMDAWGAGGCREHREEISTWLREAASKRSWPEFLFSAVRAVSSGALSWIDPSNPYGSIVDEAIRRAESGR